MNMRKGFAFVLVLLLSVFLVACEDSEAGLTSISFEGLNAVILEFQEPFNVLDGVRAKGNDGEYYDDKIVYTSLAVAKGEIDEDGNLDTTIPQTISVNYSINVDGVSAEKYRSITVKSPVATGDDMLFNGDFELGIAGWNDSSVNYVADGASMDLKVTDGVLEVEVITGPFSYTPRFGQKGVTFEKGKTYEVSFKAKALVEKRINLQVGELLTTDPWFIDFKPRQDVHKMITTEWETYSYKFTMGLETNENGAVLFEIGNVASNKVDTTLWFDNIKVEESTPDTDTEGPVFSGIEAASDILVNSVFDPLAGVQAYDVAEAKDYTDKIIVEVYNASDELITALDTSVVGTYRVVYKVKDASDNESTEESMITVVSELEQGPIITNEKLDFHGETADNTMTFEEDHHLVTVVTLGEPYMPHMYQEGMTLHAGEYTLTIRLKSSVTRDLRVNLVLPNAGWGSLLPDNFIDFNVTADVEEIFTTDFTVGALTKDVKFELDFGNLGEDSVSLAGIFEIYEIIIELK